MSSQSLKIHGRPKLADSRLVLGFSGWMDGGDVSTGTVDYLVRKLDGVKLADIDPAEFFIYNFPGSMEISALFRPHVRIEDGLIVEYKEPSNTFHCCRSENLILFSGKEPNLRWAEFAECIFTVIDGFNVTKVYFVGSVAGTVPHTKEPRFFSSVSHERLIPTLEQHGAGVSNYEGPASFITYLTTRAAQRNVDLATLVAEVPAYVQGRNAKCIHATTRKLAEILDMRINLSDLELVADDFVGRLNEEVTKRPELAELVAKMEEDYDKEAVDSRTSDLKEWFEKQDIHLD